MHNEQVEVAPLLARTASHAVRIKNPGASYGRLTIDVTAVAATPSVVVTIRAVDKVSGKKKDLLASAAIVGTGTTVLEVGPALTAAANAVANNFLGSDLEIDFTHADADSITYSAGLDLVN
jgi:hypothetical protein